MPPRRPEPSPSPRRWIWLRALLLAPVVIAALGIVAGHGGHSTLPTDTLFGGEALGSFLLLWLLAYAGMFAYAFSILALYALVVLHGYRQAVAKLRRQVAILVAALLVSPLLVDYPRSRMQAEIATSVTRVETIPASAWNAAACGRGGSICVSWRGSLGSGGVKQYLGTREAVHAAERAWALVQEEGQPLAVSWGPTPVGWVAVRQAQVAGLTVGNEWF